MSEDDHSLALSDFSLFEHDGFMEKGLVSRLAPFVKGRWTSASLYALYMAGLDSGNLGVALNSLGLVEDDLDALESLVANRAYLMARAKTLAEVKTKLVDSSGNAKEAEVLLTTVYGLTEAENKVLGTGFQVSIMNEVNVDTVEGDDVDLIEGE